MHIDHDVVTTVFVAVTALAVLLQACILLGFLILAVKIFRFVRGLINDVRPKVLPILDTTRDVVTRVAPKVDAATTDLADMVHSWRRQSAKLEDSASDAIGKIHHHAERLDSIFGGVINAVDRAGHVVAGSVSKPARQIAAVLSSIRAVVESWMSNRSRRNPDSEYYPDQDTFE